MNRFGGSDWGASLNVSGTPIVERMPVKSKKILITTASHEVFVVRRGRQKKVRAFCPACATQVEMLTLDEAVSASGRPARELIPKIVSNAVHSIETESGHLLVCRVSLKESWKAERGEKR